MVTTDPRQQGRHRGNDDAARQMLTAFAEGLGQSLLEMASTAPEPTAFNMDARLAAVAPWNNWCGAENSFHQLLREITTADELTALDGALTRAAGAIIGRRGMPLSQLYAVALRHVGVMTPDILERWLSSASTTDTQVDRWYAALANRAIDDAMLAPHIATKVHALGAEIRSEQIHWVSGCRDVEAILQHGRPLPLQMVVDLTGTLVIAAQQMAELDDAMSEADRRAQHRGRARVRLVIAGCLAQGAVALWPTAPADARALLHHIFALRLEAAAHDRSHPTNSLVLTALWEPGKAVLRRELTPEQMRVVLDAAATAEGAAAVAATLLRDPSGMELLERWREARDWVRAAGLPARSRWLTALATSVGGDAEEFRIAYRALAAVDPKNAARLVTPVLRPALTDEDLALVGPYRQLIEERPARQARRVGRSTHETRRRPTRRTR